MSESIKQLIQTLSGKERPRGGLNPAGARPAIAAGEGFAEPQKPPRTEGAGIAWPLTETSYASRETFPEEFITTSDGVFSAVIRRTKTLSLSDAAGTKGQLILKAPEAGA